MILNAKNWDFIVLKYWGHCLVQWLRTWADKRNVAGSSPRAATLCKQKYQSQPAPYRTLDSQDHNWVISLLYSYLKIHGWKQLPGQSTGVLADSGSVWFLEVAVSYHDGQLDAYISVYIYPILKVQSKGMGVLELL